MEGDEWLAADKLEHFAACFLIVLVASAAFRRSRRPFLRRRSAAFGCLTAVAAGAVKEAGDEAGLWSSAGGSFKDAVADLLGVALAALSLAISQWLTPAARRDPDRDRGIAMV